MRPPRAFAARVLEFFRRDRVEREFDEELRAHHEMMTDDLIARGHTPDEARRLASMALGFEQARERVRGERGLPGLEDVVKDGRHALRTLARSPGFTAVTVLTLALGIGVNAAIFSVFDAVVLRALPYPDAGRLVSIWEIETRPGRENPRMAVSPANVPDYQKAASLAAIGSVTARTATLTGAGTPQAVTVELATAEYFEALGVPPAVGRTFTREEGDALRATVAIISHGVWQSRFGGEPSVVGRTVLIDDQPHAIIGVMPASFRGIFDYGAREPVSMWVPPAIPELVRARRGERLIRLVGRLAPGADIERATAELTAIAEGLELSFPETNGGVRVGMRPLGEDVVRTVRTAFIVLLATVAAILSIACVNVANLLLARGVGRSREIAVRFALGASRGRVVTALAIESLLLVIAATGAGLVLAVWIQRLLLSVAPQTVPRLDEVAFDARAVVFTAAVAFATSLLFGIVSAWQVKHSRPADALAGSTRTSAGAGVMRWRSALMLAQMALSVTLLVGAGLMTRSLYQLNAVELGFATEQVVAMRIPLPEARYKTPESRLRFFETLAERVSSLPGVTRVAFANALPLRGGWSSGFRIDGVPLPEGREFLAADFQAVSPGFFQTLGIVVERGRGLLASDVEASQPIAVVSREFERRFLGGGSALGHRLRRGADAPAITIVGIVGDVRRDGRATELEPQVYLPAAQTGIYPVRLADLAVRAAGDPLDLVPAIREQVLALDAEQPLSNVRTLDDLVVAESASHRFQALLLTMFGALALLLASIGAYGVIAYIVSQRTPEIGVRLALGATTWQVYRWLLGRTAVVVAGGVVIGLVLARGLARYMGSLLFGVTPGDPASYGLAAVSLAAVGLIAGLMAARRAASISVTEALRYE